MDIDSRIREEETERACNVLTPGSRIAAGRWGRGIIHARRASLP